MSVPTWSRQVDPWWRQGLWQIPTVAGSVQRPGWHSGCGRWLVSVNPAPPGALGGSLFMHGFPCGGSLAFWMVAEPREIPPALAQIRECIDALDGRGIPVAEILRGEGLDQGPSARAVAASIDEIVTRCGGFALIASELAPATEVH